jgi:hypothetical protein
MKRTDEEWWDLWEASSGGAPYYQVNYVTFARAIQQEAEREVRAELEAEIFHHKTAYDIALVALENQKGELKLVRAEIAAKLRQRADVPEANRFTQPLEYSEYDLASILESLADEIEKGEL